MALSRGTYSGYLSAPTPSRAKEALFGWNCSSPSEQDARVSAVTILYVEDEPSDVLLLETCFSQLAVELTFRVAKDGQAAIDYLSGKGQFADRQQHPRH